MGVHKIRWRLTVDGMLTFSPFCIDMFLGFLNDLKMISCSCV